MTQVQSNPNKYTPFYLGLKGYEEEAINTRDYIAKVGFQTGGKRFFPDQIESVTYTESEITIDE